MCVFGVYACVRACMHVRVVAGCASLRPCITTLKVFVRMCARACIHAYIHTDARIDVHI